MPSLMASIKRLFVFVPLCVELSLMMQGIYMSDNSFCVFGGGNFSVSDCSNPASIVCFISARIPSIISSVNTPSSIKNFSKVLTGSFLPQISNNSFGIYFVPEASSCPRIRNVTHSNKTGRGFSRIDSAKFLIVS